MLDKSKIYREIYRIRAVEEKVAEIYPTDKIKSPIHLSIGQEAISVAVCQQLRLQDVVFMTYRGHATYLAKGGSLKRMIAEMYGKETGCCKGKGGSMHLVDKEHGIMGASAIVGTVIANAVGYAYAMRLQGKDVITAVFFGDGATDEGVFYESINFAQLKRLPIIFVCENNGLAIHTKQEVRQSKPNIAEKARVFGIPTLVFDNSVDDLFSKLPYSLSSGSSLFSFPLFVEVRTGRWREHVGPNEDFDLGYRDKSDLSIWKSRDVLSKLAMEIDPNEKLRIWEDVDAEINEAIAFAESSPFPKPEELYHDIYAN